MPVTAESNSCCTSGGDGGEQTFELGGGVAKKGGRGKRWAMVHVGFLCGGCVTHYIPCTSRRQLKSWVECKFGSRTLCVGCNRGKNKVRVSVASRM
jgi:hypothetical protein